MVICATLTLEHMVICKTLSTEHMVIEYVIIKHVITKMINNVLVKTCYDRF